MFERWGEYFLLVGSAAAVLIGLIFVVVTLMEDRSRTSVLQGARLYMGPIVLDVSLILVLSAAALVPEIQPRDFAIVAAIAAVWGLSRGIQSVVGINALTGEDAPHWTDAWFYGAIPSALFLGLGAVAWGFWSGAEWAKDGLAAVITGILLVAIRNEWDLVTWLAPKADVTAKELESLE